MAAIVLNYRTPGLVLDCLETLVGELDPVRDEVVVVDNASGDESVTRIREGLEARGLRDVTVLEAEANRGFSAGLNLGVRACRADAYLLLNSDLLILPGAVRRLWEALQEDASVGIVGPRLQWPDGTPQVSCFRDPTPWSELIGSSGTGPIRSLLSRWEVPIGVSDSPMEPEWLSFAAVLIRHGVFQSVGPLDEGFFMYFEDCDYCRRARRSGWRLRYEPAARIVHLRGGSSPVKALSAARKRRPAYYYRSRGRYFVKTYGRVGWLAANLAWVVGRGIAWLRETLGGKTPHAVEREFLDIWMRG